MKVRSTSLIMAFAAAWLWSASASAEVLIYNGFGNESKIFDPSAYISAVYSPREMEGRAEVARVGAKFSTPTGMPWLVTSILLPVSHNGVLNVRMSIVPDEGNVPGSDFLWAVTNPVQITTTPEVRTIPSNVALQSDTAYWLMLEPETFSGSEAATSWHTSVPAFAGWQATAWTNDWSGTWSAWQLLNSSDRPAFQLLGRPLNESVITEFATAIEVRFETEPGGWYVAQYCDDLAEDIWHPLWTPIVGAGGVTSVFQSTFGVTNRVFRVLTE